MARDVSISFEGEMSGLKDSLDGMKSQITSWGNSIKGIGAAAFAFVGAKEALSLGVEFASEALEAAAVQGKLEAVVKATGNAAGFTADEMADMALEMRKITGVDDDIIKGSQGIIATFKEIRDDEFKRTTQAAVDMATILGGDASSAAMQLGKALNDPEKGLSMLTKSGVGFTEEQKKMVKAMADAGDIAGAQGIILSELEGQFGGAAKAAADAKGPWAEFGMILGDVREAIGIGLLAAIEPLLPMMEEGAELVGGWAESFASLGPMITDVAAGAMDYLIGRFEILSELGGAVLTGIGDMWGMVFGESATGAVESVWSYVKDAFMAMIDYGLMFEAAVTVGFQNIPTVASYAWTSIQLGAVTLFEDLKHFFTETAPAVIGWFADNWQDVFRDIYNYTATVFENMWGNVVEFFTGVWDWLSGNETSFEFTALTDGFESSLKELPNIVERELTGLEKQLQGKLGADGAALAGAFQTKLDEYRKAVGFGDVADPESAAAAVASSGAATAGATAGQRTARAERSGGSKSKEKEFEAGFEDLGSLFKRIASSSASGKTPEVKAAEQTAEAAKEGTVETRKVADYSKKSFDELRKIKTLLERPQVPAWG